MTNEELKKKICDIIAPYVSAYGDDERIADALIAAGIGDAKGAEYRADVAELVVHEFAELLGKGDAVKEKEFYNKWIGGAKKILSEKEFVKEEVCGE